MSYVWGTDETVDRKECTKLGLHYCEPGNPWDRSKGERAYHPQAAEVDDSQESGWPSGDTVRIRCPICNQTWTKELPQ